MDRQTLQAISDTSHSINVANGFKEAASYKRSVALIISEFAEMLEADRKGKWSKDIIGELTKRDENIMNGMTIQQAHQYIITSENFLSGFKETVKDTVEDELADVVIRITSFLAANKVKIQTDSADEALANTSLKFLLRENDLPDIIYNFMKAVMYAQDTYDHWQELEGVAYACFELARHYGFDLEWHIDAKLTYNKTRPYLHGKAY